MRLGSGSIFNFAMSAAAFGFVALVVLLAHPTSQSSRVTAIKATPGDAGADASFKPVGAMSWRVVPLGEAQFAAVPTPGQYAGKRKVRP